MQYLVRFFSIQSAVARAEQAAAMVGGMLAISLVFWISHTTTGFQGSMAILPSMGASTVLLFGVPHGPLSSPWALLAGNLVSALIGVTCAALVGPVALAAGLAVGLSIMAMMLLRCVHPPGGATALAAVIGGPGITSLGYGYVLAPTLLNCLVLLTAALLFNNLFPWRRYPAMLMRYRRDVVSPDTARIKSRHIHEAISRSGVVMDVTDEQVKRIVDLADEIMRNEVAAGFELEVGAFYTNGAPGLRWAVRQVVDARPDDRPSRYMVVYRTVEGAGRGQSGSCSLDEFAGWAREKMRPGQR